MEIETGQDFEVDIFNDEDDDWLEELLEDDELDEREAGFMTGYWEDEKAGFK